MVHTMNAMWIKTLTAVILPTLDDGRTTLERTIQKAMVNSRREPWVTRRRMVDTLTPHLVTFGLKRDERKVDEDRGSTVGWLPFRLVIGVCSGWGVGGGWSLSAGCLAGMGSSRAVTSASGSGLEVDGGLRLSLYPSSPRLVGGEPGCGWTVDG